MNLRQDKKVGYPTFSIGGKDNILTHRYDDQPDYLLRRQVALPKFAVPGVIWHAYLVDPDGNTFGLFQPDVLAT